MSKSTFFKKLAVGVVISLSAGVLSTIPASAVVTTSTVSFDADDSLTLSSTSADSATATLTQVFGTTAPAVESATVYVSVTSANATNATLHMQVSDSSTSSTVTSGVASTSPNVNFRLTNASTIGTAWETGSYGAYSRNDSRTVSLATSGASNGTVKYTVGLYGISKAGTYTVVASVVNNTGSAEASTVAASATWTVTVTAQDVKAVAANTTSRIYAGTSVGTTDSKVIVSSSTLNGQAANILVTQKTAANTSASESMTATLSGAGWLTTGSSATGSTQPTSATGVKTATVKAGDYIHVWPEGVAGAASITITTFSGVLLDTETLTFHGTRTSIAVDKANYTVGRAGNGLIGYTSGAASATMGLTDVAPIVVVVKDSGGRPVTNATPTVVSSNTAVIASGTCYQNAYAANPGNTGGRGYFNCDFVTAPTAKSGDKATLTFRVTNPAITTSTEYLTVTQDVTVGGVISTETAAFDKATYEPGGAMQITFTAKDSSGNPVYDGAATASLTCNKAIIGSIASGSYVGGKYVLGDDADEVLAAPGVGGAFKCAGNDGYLGTFTVSASSSVTDATMAAVDAATDAANEAIDAANAATDAANLAAEAADAATVAAEEARDAADAATAAVEELATQVATLMAALKAQITTLANTVAKIAKKVKA
jgi:trimeric autotransporter adhesin